MKKIRLIMGMPVTIEITGSSVKSDDLLKIFDYFRYIDNKFSTYKKNSEITAINGLRLTVYDSSQDMKTIFKLAEKTKKETDGFFDIYYEGKYDPSGIVKGWAIFQASKLIKKMGYSDFYVEAGGDVQVLGERGKGKGWKVGIKNPFDPKQIIKVLILKNSEGIATSGTYIRGSHIYNPKGEMGDDVVSLTVIGPNVYEADRFATAAFTMGKKGIEFIEKLQGFEGYQIDKRGIATMTSRFEKYTID